MATVARSKPKLNFFVRVLEWERDKIMSHVNYWREELSKFFDVHVIGFTKNTDMEAIKALVELGVDFKIEDEKTAYKFSVQFNHAFSEAKRNPAFTFFVSHGVHITGEEVYKAAMAMQKNGWLTYSWAIEGMHGVDTFAYPRPGHLGYHTCMLYSAEAVQLIPLITEAVDNGHIGPLRVSVRTLKYAMTKTGGLEETWVAIAVALGLIEQGGNPIGKFVFDSRKLLEMTEKTTMGLGTDKRSADAFQVKMARKWQMALIYLTLWCVPEAQYLSWWQIIYRDEETN